MKNSSYHILMIEDNPGDIELTRSALEEIDYDIQLSSFQEAEQAFDFIRDNHHLVDLILLDLNLPKLNGLELLLKFKKYEEISAIPTLVFSTSKSPTDINQAYRFGANAYLVKPGSFNEYKAIIKDNCDYWFKQVYLRNKDAVL